MGVERERGEMVGLTVDPRSGLARAGGVPSLKRS